MQIGPEGSEGGTTQLPHPRVAENNQGSSRTTDGHIEQLPLRFDPPRTAFGQARRYHGGHDDRVTFVPLEGVCGPATETGFLQAFGAELLFGELPNVARLRGERGNHADRRVTGHEASQSFDCLLRFRPVQPARSGTGSFRFALDVVPGYIPIVLRHGRDIGQDSELVIIEQLVEPAGDVGVTTVVLAQERRCVRFCSVFEREVS